MKISKYISELLYYHDCVIIPNFGAFIANYESSEINYDSNKISPPKKKLSFNINLKSNDGLLVNHISKSENISYDESTILLNKLVNSVKYDLEFKNIVKIDKVGILSKNNDHKIIFKPSSKTNFLLDSYGFKTINYPHIQKRKDQTIKYLTYSKSFEKNLLRVAAVFLPILILSSILSVNKDKINNYYLNYAYLNPFAKKPLASYKPRLVSDFNSSTSIESISNINTKNFKTIDKSNIENSKSTEIKIETNIIPKKKYVKKNISITNDFNKKNFSLIIGSFSNYSNAVNLLLKYKKNGFKPKIIENIDKGLFRVSIHSFNNKIDAKKKLTSLKKLGIKSWILGN